MLEQQILLPEPAPILGSGFQSKDFCRIDLSESGPGCQQSLIHTYEGLNQYIQQSLHQYQARIGWGGYLERRCFYRQSPHFKNSGEDRCIHLGIDLWAPAGTPLYTPLAGQVHSFAYNDAMLDYGATIILQHQVDKQTFYSLHGHLSLNSIQHLQRGDSFEKGTLFATIGNQEENGGWVPHLHLQLITDLQGKKGDFPGVVTQADQAMYQAICPSPLSFIGYKLVS